MAHDCEVSEESFNLCIHCFKYIEPLPDFEELEDRLYTDNDDPLLFDEYENVYIRDLAPDSSLNNFNYITNSLPREWREVLLHQVKAVNLKFINRTILKVLPTDMSYQHILPKIKGSKGKILCKPCGKLYLPTKAHLHKKCLKDHNIPDQEDMLTSLQVRNDSVAVVSERPRDVRLLIQVVHEGPKRLRLALLP